MATTRSPLPLGEPGLKPAYTIAEVAHLLGIHQATVRRFIRTGELRVSRLGHRTLRITHEALMDFLRAHEEERHEEAS